MNYMIEKIYQNQALSLLTSGKVHHLFVKEVLIFRQLFLLCLLYIQMKRTHLFYQKLNIFTNFSAREKYKQKRGTRFTKYTDNNNMSVISNNMLF